MDILGILMIIDAFFCYFILKQGGKLRITLFSFIGAAICALALAFLINGEFRLGYAQLIVGVMLCIASASLLTYTILGKVKPKKE